jgi:hypothetical protein
MAKTKTDTGKAIQPSKPNRSSESLNVNKGSSKPNLQKKGTDTTDSSGPRPKK